MSWCRSKRLAVLLALLVAAMVPGSAAAAPAALGVTDLRVDQTADPLGIDDPHPGLSWRLTSDTNGERQAAYRIRVTVPGDRVVWDSGRVSSGASVGVPYGGPALRSGQRYAWTVLVWDAGGRASRWAAPAWWEMGLLSPADWHGAQWISPDTAGQDSWSDFDLDTDFTIVRGAASVVFRARDADDLYLWQVNAELSAGTVLLRPHVETGGSFAHLGPDIDVGAVITQATVHDQHHLRIEATGTAISTWLDGTLVDRLTDGTFSQGTVGFRVGDSTEDSRYDNLVVANLDGTARFGDTFSADPDPGFPRAPVTDGQLEPGDGVTLLDPDPPSPLLRHTFQLRGRVASARAYVDGLGLYQLHVNGRTLDEGTLGPADTPYDRRDLYRTYDLTRDLTGGANAVGLWLGRGFGATFSRYGFRWLGPEQAILLIDVTYADGSHQTVGTGTDGWSWSASPVTADDLYGGESYDAGLARPGWDRPGSTAASWQPVAAVPAPAGELTADDTPPVRVVRTVRPVRLTEPRPGVWVYDLGENIAGWERLRVAGPAGSTVQLRTAEDLAADGTLDTTTNRDAASTDRYTLAGTGHVETWQPRFTYHGFRYVEVTGYPGRPALDSLDGRVVHADVASTGTFSSSDALLDRIWQDNPRTILNNSMSLPTDNPVRDERTPPGMDVQAYHDASTREFGLDRFYASYLRDMPPGTALPSDDGNAQNPDMGGDQISLAWTLYQQYGDRATLAAMYPAMRRFVDTNAAAGPIWPADHGFGDWCPPVYGDGVNGGLGSPSVGACTSEVSLVNTALSYLQAHDLALAAAALGERADAARYDSVAAGIRDAFNATFLNAARDGYADGRQTTSILPLALGMVPPADVRAVGARLVGTILTTNGGHLDTGIFGTRYLVDALVAAGRIDVAMTVLDQTGYPGFGYEIGQGATTDWEEWTYRSTMESHDHAMFSGINASLYTALAGITPTTAGYATLHIGPQVPPTLSRAAATLDTVRGPVGSAWTRSGGTFTLDVTIPVNSTATVALPTFGGTPTAHATPGATRTGPTTFTVGSGHWHFTETLR